MDHRGELRIYDRQILQNKVQNLRRDYLFVITDSPF